MRLESLVSLAMLSLPFLLGFRPVLTARNVLPGIFYVSFMLFFPNFFFGNFFTYNRFGIFGLLFYVFLFANARHSPNESLSKIQPVLLLFPALVASALTVHSGIKAVGYENESVGFRDVPVKMEADERVLGLVEYRQSQFYEAPVYLHYGVVPGG